MTTDTTPPSEKSSKKVVQGEKKRGADKVARIPIKVIPTETMPRKPWWWYGNVYDHG